LSRQVTIDQLRLTAPSATKWPLKLSLPVVHSSARFPRRQRGRLEPRQRLWIQRGHQRLSIGNEGWPCDHPAGSAAASALFLNRRALHRAEGAEHATVARIRAQQRLAVAALVEVLAGIRGHRLLRREIAVRAGLAHLR